MIILFEILYVIILPSMRQHMKTCCCLNITIEQQVSLRKKDNNYYF